MIWHFWRKYTCFRGQIWLGFVRLSLSFCGLLDLWGQYILQRRVLLTVVNWFAFLANLSIREITIVWMVWKVDQNSFQWCVAFFCKLPQRFGLVSVKAIWQWSPRFWCYYPECVISYVLLESLEVWFSVLWISALNNK